MGEDELNLQHSRDYLYFLFFCFFIVMEGVTIISWILWNYNVKNLMLFLLLIIVVFGFILYSKVNNKKIYYTISNNYFNVFKWLIFILFTLFFWPEIIITDIEKISIHVKILKYLFLIGVTRFHYLIIKKIYNCIINYYKKKNNLLVSPNSELIGKVYGLFFIIMFLFLISPNDPVGDTFLIYSTIIKFFIVIEFIEYPYGIFNIFYILFVKSIYNNFFKKSIIFFFIFLIIYLFLF